MELFLYFILLIIVLLIYNLFKQLKRSFMITLICSIFIIYFILYPKLCIAATLNGAKLFFLSVFPSLFPFLIMCNLLLNYDGVKIYSKILGRYLCAPLNLPQNCSFAIVVSALCGYPLGAKYSIDLYEKKLISKEHCERLLNIASNASPLFVIGAVGTTMLQSTELGYILLISNYTSCIAMGLFLPANNKDTRYKFSANFNEANVKLNFGSALRDSIDNAVKTVLSVGGYITLFSAIIDIVSNNFLFNYLLISLPESLFPLKEIARGTLLGLIELTKGSYIISQNGLSQPLKILIIGFLIGFSGLSITSQVYSFTSRYPEFKIWLYLKRKFIQGIFNGLAALAIYMIVNLRHNAQPTLATNYTYKTGYIILYIVFISIPFLLYGIKKIFKTN